MYGTIKNMKPRMFSEEHRARLKLAWERRKEKGLSTPWNKGVKTGIVTDGAFKKGDTRIIGSNNCNWTGGKPRCCDCGKEITYPNRKRNKFYMRCKSCSKKGSLSWQWKGGKRMLCGYIQVLKPDHPNATKSGYVFEHRYIMSQAIGRPLKEFEQVHHINGIKNDNRVENLELVNEQTHSLITEMQREINKLRKENNRLTQELANEGYKKALEK